VAVDALAADQDPVGGPIDEQPPLGALLDRAVRARDRVTGQRDVAPIRAADHGPAGAQQVGEQHTVGLGEREVGHRRSGARF
jgi:hypothetical protein